MSWTWSGCVPVSVARTHSEATPTVARSELLRDGEVRGGALREALSRLYDGWLRGLMPGTPGLALVAVGGLGRGQPAPYGDLDLVLVHTGGPDVAAAADALWYPIWDAGLSLDHSVRTVAEAIRVAGADAKVAVGLLDTRFIAGDPALAAALRTAAYATWRAKAHLHLPVLHELAVHRHRSAGELAFLLEPDLKDSAGGIRDALVLRALAAAQLTDDPPPAVRVALTMLLDVRGELHRRAGRAGDRLVAQEQVPIAAALDLGDADDLLRVVSASGRRITFTAESGWRSARAELDRRVRWRPRRRPDRQPLADGVVAQDGEVVLARSAVPSWDPALLLRAAAAAATVRLPLSEHTLTRLSAEAPELPAPWPRGARDGLVALLDTGPGAIPVLEAMDQHGLLTRLLPEWEQVRFLPQRNPVHRFTVDRHLIEAAAEAAGLTRQVARPDLLLLGALLHDIGKGYPGDHSAAGAVVARAICTRMGLLAADVAVVTRLVRHHLLLPDTATRRDLDDPVTLEAVGSAVGGSVETLRLLHALAVADARATGPAAWSDWKAGLITTLVERVAAGLAGAPLPSPPRLSAAQRAGTGADRLTVTLIEDELVVAAPDSPGLLSRLAGLLAVHGLDIRAATVTTEDSRAVNVFTVSPRFGRAPDVQVLRGDLTALLAGRYPLAQRLGARERAYPGTAQQPPRVLWFDDESAHATIVELRAADSVGLLHRVTGALERCGLNIRTARLSTLGASVVDAFYVTTAAGQQVTEPSLRDSIEQELLAAATGRAG